MLYIDTPVNERATPEWIVSRFKYSEHREIRARRAIAGEHTGCPVAISALSWSLSEQRQAGPQWMPCAGIPYTNGRCHAHGGVGSPANTVTRVEVLKMMPIRDRVLGHLFKHGPHRPCLRGRMQHRWDWDATRGSHCIKCDWWRFGNWQRRAA